VALTTLELNNQTVTVDSPPDTPLLWVLRDYLGMTGTKFGCGATLCRACTVHVDGVATFSCVLPLSAVAGRKVTTIEGVSGRVAHAVQDAWDKIQVPQCGYCQSGQVMSAVALLSTNAKPSDAEIDAAMKGNLCRCGTYQRIRLAIHAAAKQLEA
jgi:isoquinoline 1-oxidoreductase alpha subunit